MNEESEQAITTPSMVFIAGALRETYVDNHQDTSRTTQIIDSIVTHRVWGYPIFFLFLYLMFEGTFVLGDYPMQGIEWLVGELGDLIRDNMSEGPLKDLLVDGIVGGVGGVIVFLPNILLLYFFISLMEDSGYMARAAFIMDKIMHKMGLHGKSFIPLIMGFGCNVPAIMASRTIENRKSRLVTMLINPLMSCSARLPHSYLFAGRRLLPEQCELCAVGNLCHRYSVGSAHGTHFLPLPGERGRYTVRHGAAALSYADVQGHLPPYVGEGSAVSPQDGRYHYGGIHRYLGIGILSQPR